MIKGFPLRDVSCNRFWKWFAKWNLGSGVMFNFAGEGTGWLARMELCFEKVCQTGTGSYSDWPNRMATRWKLDFKEIQQTRTRYRRNISHTKIDYHKRTRLLEKASDKDWIPNEDWLPGLNWILRWYDRRGLGIR